MTYVLVITFLLSGNTYLGEGGLSRRDCLDQAVIAQAELNSAQHMVAAIGKARVICLPEGHALGRVARR